MSYEYVVTKGPGTMLELGLASDYYALLGVFSRFRKAGVEIIFRMM